jgi:NTP pyrophosphatase (non-canonical NTP hydrolase)
MELNEYQEAVSTFALYQHKFYPIASLMVEAGELSDLFVKPMLRGDDKELSRSEIVSEAGDVLWNLSMLLKDNKITLEEVAQRNIHKLQDRMDRNVIKGSGGQR